MSKSKLLSIMVSFLFVSFSLSACGKVNSTEKINSSENLQGSITVYADAKDTEYLNTSVNSFINRNTNTKINVKTLDEDEIVKKYIENYGKEEQGDIIILKEEKIKEILSKYEDKFLALSGNDIKDKSNLIEDKYKNLSIGNNQYGVPWYVNPIGILYRKDILASINVNVQSIKTWQDYIHIGDALNANNLPKLLSINVNNMNYITLTMLQQLATTFTIDSKYALNSDNVLKIGSTIKTLIEKSAALQVGSDNDEFNKFINGESASLIVTSTDLKKIEDIAPNLKDKLQFEKVPAFENGGNRDAAIRGSGVLINKDSKNKELSIAFMNYLSSDYQSMKGLYEKFRLIPAHYIIYVSDDFSANDEYYGKKVFEEEVETVKKSFNYNYIDEYELLRKVFVNSIKNSISSKEEMKLTLDKLQNNINDIIANASVKN